MSELVKRLRRPVPTVYDAHDAADRIEQLEAALRGLLQATGEGPRRDAALIAARTALQRATEDGG